MQRIIFLDIDGPMIPGSMFLKNPRCSFERDFSPVCMTVIDRLCAHTGAKIVFNTTHNTAADELVTAWAAQGDRTLLHKRCHTAYPAQSRFHAIHGWLAVELANTGVRPQWVALDDEHIGKEKDGYILVDFDSGLTLAHYNKAMRHFGKKPLIIS